MTGKLQLLAAARIQVHEAPGAGKHLFLERDGFVALVRPGEDGLDQLGAAGLITEKGFAALVWRGETPFFVARGFEVPASADQLAALRRFDADVRAALA